jgi:hypothetical protein
MADPVAVEELFPILVSPDLPGLLRSPGCSGWVPSW